MNTRREKSGCAWFLIIAGTVGVAVTIAVGAQPPEAAYDQSCLAPYRDELAGWQPAQLDEDAYRQVVRSARAVAAESCSAFVERIEREGQAGAQESRQLQNARDLLADTPQGKCIEARVVSELVRSAESLFELALCHSGEEETALLREAVEMDPGHLGSLLFLMSAELDSETRAEYGESLYQLSDASYDRVRAGKAIIEWAMENGDLIAVQEIHDRFKRHLLGQPLRERCGQHLDILGLEEVCLVAIEMMAADALAADEELPHWLLARVSYQYWRTYRMIDLPDQVRSEAEVAEMLATPGMRAKIAADFVNAPEYLEMMKDDVVLTKLLRGEPVFIEKLDHDALLVQALDLEPWRARRAAQAARLKAVLENHPEPLRTAEHQLELAVMVSTWGERIALLQGAVRVEPGHVLARCELAGALAATGDLAGARRGYQSLLADDDGSCNAKARLKALDDRPATEAASLEDPHDIVVLN